VTGRATPKAEQEQEQEQENIRFGASLARHFSIWPFGMRTLRLFLLVDPRPAEGSLVRAVLRAMQYEYFRWETGSQTRAVRSTLLAAHDILRHHNRGLLAYSQATSAGVVAAARGPWVYVAMAGDAAAFSWSAGVLEGRHATRHVERPLGLEPEPQVTLWSAPFGPGDRLVLACGADWHVEAKEVVRQILSTSPTELAAPRIADALVGPNGPTRVLVADGVPGGARRDSVARPRTTRASRSGAVARRLVPAMLGLLLLTAVGASPCNPLGEPRHFSLARQAIALLQQAEQTTVTVPAGLPAEVSGLLPLRDLFVVHADGRVARYDRQGNPLPFSARAPEGPLGRVASAAPDGSGGLFLADPDRSRVVETADDGSFVRQLRAGGMQGLRALHLRLDGRVLYGLARDGILAIKL
jgi:hypothetical protein